jgi:3-oxoacyl-[acyl-carrier protein] reductase
MPRLAGRVALVTGSTQGLGLAMAIRLLEEGARVVIAGRSAERAAEVAAGLDQRGERVLGVGLDVRSRADFEAAFKRILDRWGQLDVLVNNAGTTAGTRFLEVTDEEWDDVLATNLRSVQIGCQLAAPIMRRQGWGRIINHASLAGQQGGLVTGPHYAASKAGIIVLTKIVAAELAGDGITVNAIAPAAIEAPPMKAMPAEQIEALPRKIPVGRIGLPEDVAALVAFLASDEASFITGSTVDVNGGLFMR